MSKQKKSTDQTTVIVTMTRSMHDRLCWLMNTGLYGDGSPAHVARRLLERELERLETRGAFTAPPFLDYYDDD